MATHPKDGTNQDKKPYILIIEDTNYWKGQMIYIGKAEIEDGDFHYNNWDLDAPERN